MTRKLIILFVVLLISLYSLISSFLGERGFLVNNSIKRQLKENEYQLDRMDVEIENLEIQEKELSSEDGLRSAAMGLGYQVESDDVYVFPTDDQTEASNTSGADAQVEKSKEFEPWSTPFTLLISFVASTIITVLVGLIAHHKGNIDDSEQEESGNSGDDFDND